MELPLPLPLKQQRQQKLKMPKPLSSIQELVELTVFHNLRTEIVSQGYLPDITTYANSEAGYTAYKAALTAIANSSKNFAVEVYNNSNPDYKGLAKLPRIVMISELMVPGEIGANGTYEYQVTAGETFSKLYRPPQTVDFAFNLHVIADNAPQLRVMNAMIANSLPLRGYIPAFLRTGLNSSVFNFFIENISATPLPILRTENFAAMEYVYRYQVKDIFLTEYQQKIANIPALQELLVKYYADNKFIKDMVVS